MEGIRWLFATDDVGETQEPRGLNRVRGCGTFPVREVTAVYRQVKGIRKEAQPEPDDEGNLFFEEVSLPRLGAQLELRACLAGGAPDLTWDIVVWDDSFHVGEVEQPAIPATTITPYAHRTERTPIARTSQAINEGWRAEVVALLQRIDDSIEGLEILAPTGTQPQLFLTHRKWGSMPLEAFGDGIRRILTLALAIPSSAGGVLLVDEVENSVHALALNKVFSWLIQACQEHRVQLFATTHSLEAVDAMLQTPEAEQHLVAYRLASNTAQRFNGETLHHLRYDRGLDIRWR